MTAVIQTRLALGSPEGRRRGAWPSFASLEAFLDLGAVAVEVLDLGRGPVADVGQDEAVAEHAVKLAGERELQLLGMDRLSRRARGLRDSSRAQKQRRRTINLSGSCFQPSGV